MQGGVPLGWGAGRAVTRKQGVGMAKDERERKAVVKEALNGTNKSG
jgi:hypothetical protein